MSCEVLSQRVCDAANELYYGGSFLHVATAIRVVFVAISIPSLIYLCYAVTKTALHFNVRCLLMSMMSWMTLGNFGVLLSSASSLHMIHWIEKTKRCDYLTELSSACLLFRQLWNSGSSGFAMSTVLLAIERTVATIRFRTYETEGLRWIGLGLCCIQLLAAIYPIVFTSPSGCYPFCGFQFIYPESSRTLAYAFLGQSIVSLFAFVILYNLNKKCTDNIFNVAMTRRFQLLENKTTTRLMIPIMIVVAVMTTVTALTNYFYVPQDLEKIENFQQFVIVHELQLSVLPLLSITMMILLPHYNHHIKRFVLGRENSIEETLQIEENNDTLEGHFDFITNQWNTEYNNRQRQKRRSVRKDKKRKSKKEAVCEIELR